MALPPRGKPRGFRAMKIYDGLTVVAYPQKDDAFSDLYSHLRSIKWSYLEKPREGARLAGKSFVLTGKMEHPRSYYEDAIQKAGGTVQPAVSAKTDFLVIADVTSTSSKAQKARKLGTKLVSPEEVLSMCNS